MATDLGNLKNKSKGQLIELIEKLSSENEALKGIQSFMESANKKFEKLERDLNKSLQYSRRDTIETTGIPEDVTQNNLEEDVKKVFSAAGVKVHGDNLEHRDIQACHRIGRKGVTIVKFVNRKFAREGLYKGKNLKGKTLYGPNTKIFINDSFCHEFKYLNYVIRKAKSDALIFRWKVRNGTNFVQMKEAEEFVEISHKK